MNSIIVSSIPGDNLLSLGVRNPLKEPRMTQSLLPDRESPYTRVWNVGWRPFSVPMSRVQPPHGEDEVGTIRTLTAHAASWCSSSSIPGSGGGSSGDNLLAEPGASWRCTVCGGYVTHPGSAPRSCRASLMTFVSASPWGRSRRQERLWG
jgi:hypothetical protein